MESNIKIVPLLKESYQEVKILRNDQFNNLVTKWMNYLGTQEVITDPYCVQNHIINHIIKIMFTYGKLRIGEPIIRKTAQKYRAVVRIHDTYRVMANTTLAIDDFEIPLTIHDYPHASFIPTFFTHPVSNNVIKEIVERTRSNGYHILIQKEYNRILDLDKDKLPKPLARNLSSKYEKQVSEYLISTKININPELLHQILQVTHEDLVKLAELNRRVKVSHRGTTVENTINAVNLASINNIINK